ncbi:MAG: hypothetical protein FJ267_12340 [Planctomycetes bacterium]|nr:hypothetical protein [Planctomycetota bacterium]
MNPSKQSLILPFLLFTIGSGWLLTTLGVAPGINWIWTLGPAVTGVLVLVISGIDKFTVVVGPFFIVASCLSVLRQTGRLPSDIEAPFLVIVLGVLFFVIRMPVVPIPKWVVNDAIMNANKSEKKNS